MTHTQGELAVRAAGRGTMDPIFICGAPRTGVRLLAALLDGQGELASGPELPFVVTMARQWKDLDATLGVNHEKNYALPREATRTAFRAAILKLFAPRLAQVGKDRFVYHSFAAALSLDALVTVFPEAKFILTVRDPVEVARSLLRCHWRNPRDGQALPYTQDVRAGARFWTEFTSVMAQSASVLGANGRMLWLRYEDLCRDPLRSLHALGGFIGSSPLDAEIESASATFVTAAGEPHPELRPGKIDTASVDRAHQELALADIAAIKRITAPLRAQFGYA